MPHASTGTSRWWARERAPSGAMTASMRAVGATTRVLRIALVRDGRIVEERVMRERVTVTCGTSERCTFVVGGPAPERHALFEIVGGRYVLDVARGMRGRVADASGVHEIAGSIGSRIDLDDDARGKIVVGDTSVIFQHVNAPVDVRPTLPLSVRSGLGVDWDLTVIAAFSFLVHFGIVGASYSDFADPVHDEESIVSVVDEIANLPSPIDVESTPAVEPTTSPDTSTPSAPPKATTTTKPTSAPSAPRPGVSPDEAEQAKVALLLAYGKGQRVAVLDPNAPLLPGGVWVGRPGDARDPNALPMRPDAPLFVPPGPSEPAPTTTVRVDPTPVVVSRPALPPFIVSPGPPVGQGPIVDPAPLASLGPRARYCYQQALARNPDQQGRVVIAIEVGPAGDVVGSNVVSSSGLDASVGACILGGTTALRFKSPGPTGGQVNVPFTFVKQ